MTHEVSNFFVVDIVEGTPLTLSKAVKYSSLISFVSLHLPLQRQHTPLAGLVCSLVATLENGLEHTLASFCVPPFSGSSTAPLSLGQRCRVVVGSNSDVVQLAVRSDWSKVDRQGEAPKLLPSITCTGVQLTTLTSEQMAAICKPSRP